ncbi:PilT/PilU family type 4a pilus ATPase [Orbaceae bacterium ESL0727]|nr:PilT/PilU family type 4a pilus ATPase [Orbaceae bacterium ESL0727]
MSNLNIDSILAFSLTQNASDVHFSSNEVPYIRQYGQLHRLPFDVLVPFKLKSELLNLLNESQRNVFEQVGQIDFAYQHPEIGRFRVNIFYQRRGISAVFRVINQHIPTLQELAVPDIFAKLAEKEQGIILVTGATGSGKSTTLASLIQHINMTAAKHIITLEDPIEFIYQNELSLIQQREVSTFSSALHGLLRQDPDIILLGELRDRETVQVALTAAETGHLVLATLHTNSAIQTINRIIDLFDGHLRDFIRLQLASSLEAIICQKLVRHDKKQKAVYEVLINTPAVSNLISEGKIKQIYSLMQTGQQYGMQVMRESSCLS